MKRPVLCLALAALILVVLVACKKDKDNDPTGPYVSEHIVPLRVGNQWTYVDFFYNRAGRDSSQSVLRNSDSINIDGEEVFFWNWSNQAEDLNWLVSNRSDGMHTRGGMSSSDTLIVDNLKFKFPVQLNQPYASREVTYGSDTFSSYPCNYVCISNDTTFTTYMGTYHNCYVYTRNLDSLRTVDNNAYHGFLQQHGLPELVNGRPLSNIRIICKPNIGYIGYLSYYDNNTLVYEKRLLNFTNVSP